MTHRLTSVYIVSVEVCRNEILRLRPTILDESLERCHENGHFFDDSSNENSSVR